MNIEITNLIKNFGDKTAVNIPNFSISQGQILGLVGNNGAGKTTLFRLLLDLLAADKGKVEYTDETQKSIDPSQSELWKKWTAAYIDDGFLIDFLTTEEYFDFIRKTGEEAKKTEENAAIGSDNLNYDDFIKEYQDRFTNGEIFETHKLIRDFSAGNKQKIGILSTFLNMPKILILDEPFNFLDPSSQNMLKVMLKKYNEETGATIIVSSHNLEHITEICNRVVLMEHGKIIQDIENHDRSAKVILENYFKVAE